MLWQYCCCNIHVNLIEFRERERDCPLLYIIQGKYKGDNDFFTFLCIIIYVYYLLCVHCFGGEHLEPFSTQFFTFFSYKKLARASSQKRTS